MGWHNSGSQKCRNQDSLYKIWDSFFVVQKKVLELGARGSTGGYPGGRWGVRVSRQWFFCMPIRLSAAVVVKSPARDGQARATAHSVNSMSMGHS
jgi:hypothetical protein